MGNVFVTGATGFLGSTLLPELHAAGHKLRCLVRPGSSEENIVDIPYERIEGCLTDDAVLQEGVRGADMVVHMAALVSFHKKDTERIWQTNARGTELVARAARLAGVGRFLHVSTAMAVGGSKQLAIMDELYSFDLQGVRVPYLTAKRAGERAVLSQVARGLDAVVVNPTTMFGPGDRRDNPNWVMQAIANDKIRMFPPGGVCVSDVRDVTAGCIAALEHGRTGERYILGGDNIQTRQLVLMIHEALGKRPPTRRLPRPVLTSLASIARVLEAFSARDSAVTAQILRLAGRYFYYSSRKAEEELGYEWRPALDTVRDTKRWSFDDADQIDAAAESTSDKIRA